MFMSTQLIPVTQERYTQGGHPLGLFASAGPTRPAGMSDATSFGAMILFLPFKSDHLTSFVLQFRLCPERTRTAE